jgi:hypothetical protein
MRTEEYRYNEFSCTAHRRGSIPMAQPFEVVQPAHQSYILGPGL